MEVVTNTVDEFIENLRKQEGEPLHKIIYVNQNREPLNADPRNATSFNIGIEASCVIINPDGTQILLKCYEFCGKDVMTQDGTVEGTEKFNQFRGFLEQYAGDVGITLMPGIVSA